MRWRDEDGIWSTPGNLLTLAHEAGLTDDVTALVLEETLASLDAINDSVRRDAAARLQHRRQAGLRHPLHARLPA